MARKQRPPRKLIQIRPEAHEKALYLKQVIETQTGLQVTLGSVIEQVIDQAAREVEAKN